MKAALLILSLGISLPFHAGIGAEQGSRREFIGEMDWIANEAVEIFLGVRKVGELVKDGAYEPALSKAEALLRRIEQFQRRTASSFKVYPAKPNQIEQQKIWLERIRDVLNRKLGPAEGRITI